MLVALVIDGLDQTIFQTFTSLDLSGYQQYDKALDVYYLSIAYSATMRNWTNLDAFSVSRFLYYYRLVGVVAFELTQVRALLLVFPNTFEYFFDAYEARPGPLGPAPDEPRGSCSGSRRSSGSSSSCRRSGGSTSRSSTRPTPSRAHLRRPDRHVLARRVRGEAVGARGRRRSSWCCWRRGLMAAHPTPAAGRSPADVRRRRQPAARRPDRHRARTAPARRAPVRSGAPREDRPGLAGQRDLRPDAAGRRGGAARDRDRRRDRHRRRTPPSASGSSGAPRLDHPATGGSS